MFISSRCSVEVDGHISSKVPEERGSSLDFNLTSGSCIEVVESGLEVLSQVILSSLALETHVGAQDLISSHFSFHRSKNETTSGFSFGCRLFESVVLVHGPHKLIAASPFNVELLGNGPRIGTEMLLTLEIIPVSGEARVRMVLVPLGGDVPVLVEFDSLAACSCHHNQSNRFHFIIL